MEITVKIEGIEALTAAVKGLTEALSNRTTAAPAVAAIAAEPAEAPVAPAKKAKASKPAPAPAPEPEVEAEEDDVDLGDEAETVSVADALKAIPDLIKGAVEKSGKPKVIETLKAHKAKGPTSVPEDQAIALHSALKALC